jgi:hypothetical protein
MEQTAATDLVQRLRRFARWFFTVTPEAIAEPAPTAKPKSARRRARRPGRASLRTHHAGRMPLLQRDRS